MKLTTEIADLVTQIVARDVAAGVELARSIGHPMPKDFAVGVRFIEDGERTRVRMRLDDAHHDSIVQLPHLDGGQSLATTDAMWKTAWERIHTDALILAQIWLDKHPEVNLSQKTAVKAIAILDALEADAALHASWRRACRDRAKHFVYR
jgi:hypothetical protein